MEFKPVIDAKFINGQQVWWRPMGSGQDPEQAEYFLFCGRKEDPRFRFSDGREISADRGEWAPMEVPSIEGNTPHSDICRCSDCARDQQTIEKKYYELYSPEGSRIREGFNEWDLWVPEVEVVFGHGIVKKKRFAGASRGVILERIGHLKDRGYYIKVDIRHAEIPEVIAAMNGCYELVGGVQIIIDAHLDGNYRGATEALSDIMTLIDTESTRKTQAEARRLYELYGESKADSGVKGTMSAEALDKAIEGFAEIIKRELHLGSGGKGIFKKLWAEYESTIPPEVAARIKEALNTSFTFIGGEVSIVPQEQEITKPERAPLTGEALKVAVAQFLEQLTWAIYGDVHMERTVEEIREEHEAAAPPEVVAYVRAEFAKVGRDSGETDG